ncbi:hypothetical protein GCM10028807_33500 [Spirosoma daeguense]
MYMLAMLLGLTGGLQAQIRVGMPTGVVEGSATLDVNAGAYPSGSPYRGLLMPKVNTSQRNQIQSPATGLMVFNTSTNQIEVNTGTPGGPVWTPGGAVSGGGGGGSSWNLSGNAGTSGGNFLGTTDNAPLYFRVNNQNSGQINVSQNNTGLGYISMNLATTGLGNSAFGSLALTNNTSGNYNTGTGLQALTTNTTGTGNTAFGATALQFNVGGNFNTAAGYQSLRSNTAGIGNTAVGAVALLANTTGSNNTALGQVALNKNISGDQNTSIGAGTMENNTTGYQNTVVGFNALKTNTTGYVNTAVGIDALYNTTVGYANTAIGASALEDNIEGGGNMAAGVLALSINTNGVNNSAAGTNSLRYNVTGNYNSALGYDAGPPSGSGNLSNTTAIGANAKVNASNTIVLGDNQISSLRCNVTSISTLSDKRIKESIKANVPGLGFITRLNPVTYYVNKQKEAQLVGYNTTNIQPDKVRHSGFLAQDVEAAAKAVGYDFEGVKQEEGGKYYTLGYTLFVIPLVQAVKDLNTEVEQLKAKVQASETAYNQLAAQVKQMQDVLGVKSAEKAAKASKK